MSAVDSAPVSDFFFAAAAAAAAGLFVEDARVLFFGAKVAASADVSAISAFFLLGVLGDGAAGVFVLNGFFGTVTTSSPGGICVFFALGFAAVVAYRCGARRTVLGVKGVVEQLGSNRGEHLPKSGALHRTANMFRLRRATVTRPGSAASGSTAAISLKPVKSGILEDRKFPCARRLVESWSECVSHAYPLQVQYLLACA